MKIEKKERKDGAGLRMRQEGRGLIHKNHIAPRPLHCYKETTFGSCGSMFMSLYIIYYTSICIVPVRKKIQHYSIKSVFNSFIVF